jgi:hypothetical protein
MSPASDKRGINMIQLNSFKYLMLLVAVFLLFSAAQAHADSLFSGGYAVGNFTTTLSNSNGGLNTSLAPASVLLTGPNLNDSSSGETLFSLIAPTTTTIIFDWTYTTYDWGGAQWDPEATRSMGPSSSSRPSLPFRVLLAAVKQRPTSSPERVSASTYTQSTIFWGLQRCRLVL